MIISDKDADTNAKMARLCPELASRYATYPLQRKMWVDPRGKTAEGKPLFIKGEGSQEPARKDDYVYGPGPLGWGYYHLLTRVSYEILFRRMHSSTPFVCCCFATKEARMQLSDHEDVRLIMYNRSVASIPDDKQAAKDAIAIATGTAKAVYNYTQNEQLVFNMVNLAV